MGDIHVKILECARDEIKIGRETFICISVEHCFVGDMHPTEAQEIMDQIRTDLDGSYTYDSWLERHHGIDTEGKPLLARAARLEWIDALIEYWKHR